MALGLCRHAVVALGEVGEVLLLASRHDLKVDGHLAEVTLHVRVFLEGQVVLLPLLGGNKTFCLYIDNTFFITSFMIQRMKIVILLLTSSPLGSHIPLK